MTTPPYRTTYEWNNWSIPSLTIQRLQAWITAYRVEGVESVDADNARVSFTAAEDGVVYDIPWGKFWDDRALRLTAQGLEWGVDDDPPAFSQFFNCKAERNDDMDEKTKTVLEYIERAQSWAKHHKLNLTRAFLKKTVEDGPIIVDGGQEIQIPWEQFWADIPDASASEKKAKDETTTTEPKRRGRKPAESTTPATDDPQQALPLGETVVKADASTGAVTTDLPAAPAPAPAQDW